MKNIAILISLFVLISCSSEKTSNETSATEPLETDKVSAEYPELLTKALEAHGSLALWNNKGTMQYDLKMANSELIETHIIDLRNRNVRINGEGFTIGMDGQNVWSSPSNEATGKNSPRFYHNLFFYFFSIPFVLADPGINYEDLGEVTMMGNTYGALSVSFNEGVGDADKDLYIGYFNPETFQLEVLLYTVTYYSGEKHENYNALVYDNYKNINGILLPTRLKGHKYENDSIGDLRYDISFSNISLSEERPESTLFAMPAESEIDSLTN